MNRLMTLFSGAALTLALTSGAFAGNVTKTVTFSNPVEVNGTKIEPGNYKVSYDDATANTQLTFKKGKKDIAIAPAQVKQLNTKVHETSVEFNDEGSTRKLQEIRFGGTNQAVVLSGGGSATTAGQ